MNKKQILIILGSVFLLGILSGCSKVPGISKGNIMPPPPPTGENIGPDDPRNPQEFNEMRKKLDAACISGIMQTGSDIFKELTRNGTDKLSKLKFIKEKLQSIYLNAKNSESKTQINNQMKIINEMIMEMENREKEVKADPNIICRQTEELKKLNKNIKERIIGLSGDMNNIREHEKREGIFQHMKEKIFGENPKEDFENSNKRPSQIEK